VLTLAQMGKKAKVEKRPHEEDADDDAAEAQAAKQGKFEADDIQQSDSRNWVNKQRTLVFCSRGVSYRARHLMMDLRALLPHSKKESKMERKVNVSEMIPEICELRNCNNCIYFEMRKKQDLYMWISKMPTGPSVKFLIENIHTMSELKFTGNSLKGSRPLLNFDQAFDTQPQFRLFKELLFQAFGTPKGHPKSKPFVDRVLSFFILDNRIWMRNYEIVWPNLKEGTQTKLVEIGPRLILNPIRVFDGTFGGSTLYVNPDYVSPNEVRRNLRLGKAIKHKADVEHVKKTKERTKELAMEPDEVDNLFFDA